MAAVLAFVNESSSRVVLGECHFCVKAKARR
jgi:hypothetical protein